MIKRKNAFALVRDGFLTLKSLAADGRFWAAYVFIFGVFNLVAAQVVTSTPDDWAGHLKMSFYIGSNLSLFFTTAVLLLLGKSKQEFTGKRIVGDIWRVWKANFVAGFYIILGFICFIIPGIVLVVRYLYVDEAVVLEGQPITDSLRRSRKLSSFNGGTLLISYGIVLVCYFLVVMVAGAVVAVISEPALDSFLFNYFVEIAVTAMTAMFAAVGYNGYLEAIAGTEAIESAGNKL